MQKGLDANQSLMAVAGALVVAGYSFVGRYLAHSTKKDPLTRAEAQHLLGQGLDILLIYESGFPTSDAYFTSEQGRADGNAAFAAVSELGVPTGTGRAIFFTVDEDAPPGAVFDYFDAIRATQLLGPYLIGVYASTAVCERLEETGIAHYTWVAQAGGWEGGFEGFPGKQVQQGPTKTITFGDEEIDADLDTEDVEDFGQWKHAAG